MISPKLDPNVRALLEFIQSQGGPRLESMTPVEARAYTKATFAAVAGAPDAVRSVEDPRIPGPAGEIPVRIYRPGPTPPAPPLGCFPGGGRGVCHLDRDHGVGAALARRARAVRRSACDPLRAR